MSSACPIASRAAWSRCARPSAAVTRLRSSSSACPSWSVAGPGLLAWTRTPGLAAASAPSPAPPPDYRCFVAVTSPHRLALGRSEEHTSELQSLAYLVCRLLLETKKQHAQMKIHAMITDESGVGREFPGLH